MSSAFVFRPTASPQEAANWSRRQIIATDLRTIVGRAYPRVTGLFREKSWVFFEIAPAVPRDVRVRLRLSRRPGAAGVHRLRRPGRGDDGVLAQRHLE